METAGIFNDIMTICPKKKVIGLCKKLMKKCSFKSGSDVENLCRLTYWLYIYGHNDKVVEICKMTHDVEFNGNYRIWDFIYPMWGLEARILPDETRGLIDLMDEQLKLPDDMSSASEMLKEEQERRSRFVYPEIAYHDEIHDSLSEGDAAGANEWRLLALFDLIGKTETGLYPNLNKCKPEIEMEIKNYISELLTVT
jgi:hypothetical protein